MLAAGRQDDNQTRPQSALGDILLATVTATMRPTQEAT
jgi:hypothetical protein